MLLAFSRNSLSTRERLDFSMDRALLHSDIAFLYCASPSMASFVEIVLTAAVEKVAAYSAELEKLKDSAGDTQQQQAELTEEIERWGKKQADAEAASRAAEKSVQAWQKQLNNARIDLNDLSDEIDRNNQYLEEAQGSADQCARSIDQYGREVKEAGAASGFHPAIAMYSMACPASAAVKAVVEPMYLAFSASASISAPVAPEMAWTADIWWRGSCTCPPPPERAWRPPPAS